MNLDTQLGVFDLEKVGEEAKRLERMGFDPLWSFETAHDPFLPLTVAALATNQIKLGTNITVGFARSPMVTAMAAWDLQRASKGRFLLGIGTQVRMHVERRFSGQWESPAPRVKELIECIRAIWDCWQNGSRPNFKGKFYQFRLMTPFFNPGPNEHPHIPIYLAGVNPRMCRTAGEVADGFHSHPFHSVRYLQEVVRPNLDEGARTRGKTVDDLDISTMPFTISANSEAERSRMEQRVREQISFYASTPNYRGVMSMHGWEGVAERLSKMARAGEWQQMGNLISDEMLETFAVFATPDKLAAVLQERYAGISGRIALYDPIPGGDPEAPWQAFVKAFKQAA